MSFICGPPISLDESHDRDIKEFDTHIKQLELILDLDDAAFQNEFVQQAIEVALEKISAFLKRFHETARAIDYWRAQGKDTSKTYEHWDDK